MAYNVIDINLHSKPKDTNYVFDTNVLLPVLGFPPNPKNPDQEKKYLTYFNAVYNHLQGTDYKIFIPSVQLSELFNRLLQAEAKKYYKSETHGEFGTFYKRGFRAMTACQQAFDIYKEGLLIYADVVSFKEFEEKIKLADLLDYNVQKLDINDVIILKLAQKTNAILVSHDADYEGLNIAQATLNNTLIKNARNKSINPRHI